MTSEPLSDDERMSIFFDYLPVNMLASSRSTRVPSLVEIQVKCKGSTSRRPVSAVKLPSAAAQLLTLPFPAGQNTAEPHQSHFKLEYST